MKGEVSGGATAFSRASTRWSRALLKRGSPRFEAWLRAKHWFGPPLQRFLDTCEGTQSAKAAALLSMGTAIATSSFAQAVASMPGPLVTIAPGEIGTAAILVAVRAAPETACLHN